MALNDPQSITISGTAVSLPRTSSGVNQGTFSASDGTVVETVSHQYGKRTRRLVRVDHSKIAPDPLISDRNIKHSLSAYLVVDAPITGYTVTEAKDVVKGLVTQLTASSDAVLVKFLDGEN